MPDHLPRVYTDFRARFPEVAHAQDALGAALDAAGPLDERTARLVKLGIAIGSQAEGAVRSNVRKALAAGATPGEVEQVVVLSLTTRGFPALIAAWGWVREVLDGDVDAGADGQRVPSPPEPAAPATRPEVGGDGAAVTR